MPTPAHIGNIPVEEWLPFVVPVVLLFVWGRRRERRRRGAVAQLPPAAELLDATTRRRVRGAWDQAGFKGLSGEELPLLYPPGPDGLSAAELAARCEIGESDAEGLLETMEDGGYVELEEREGREGRRAWLTFEGFRLMDVTESELVRALAEQPAAEGARR